MPATPRPAEETAMTKSTRNLLGFTLVLATALTVQPQANACTDIGLWATLATSENATESARAIKDVSKFLREIFVLHWKSVRPVPKVTIDFGDGRVVERTITGNSIHYVLDGDGNVIDGIPGLYGPEAFRQQLANDLVFARQIA